ncbi:hypothetical protein BJ912DRAFT_1060162 [Pholiota molesta]|nr:hypothetical protein BJ912DRAFT_1060162 [Pholiota molesta]
MRKLRKRDVIGNGTENVWVMTPDADTVAFIRCLGWYHQMNCMPVVSETAFGLPKPAFRHDSVERYVDANLQLGSTADLYHCTPWDYHSKIADGSEAFQLHYVRGASAGLASALHRLRSIAGQVFDIKQDVFRNLEVNKRSRRSMKTVPATGPAVDLEKSATSVDRANDPAIRKLLGITSVTSVSNGKKITTDAYADIPPVLFKPGHERDMKYLFQNPQMYQFVRVVIYGPSNLDAEKPSLHKNNSYRHADGRPIEATSGLIAWFGVMIEYTLLPDQEFGAGGIGTHTGTDYLEKHARYRRLLIEGRHAKNSTIIRIFCEWNKNVFPTTKTADEEESSEDEDHIETQRRARDGAQPIADLLSQMSESESDAGDSESPSSESEGGPGRSGDDIDSESDAHTVDGDMTIRLENLSLSITPPGPNSPLSALSTLPNSPASPGPNPTHSNSISSASRGPGPSDGANCRRLVRSRDAEVAADSDGVDHYHVSSADFNVTIPSFSSRLKPTSSVSSTPSESRPTTSLSKSKRPVISARGAAVNPDLFIPDSVSAAIPAIGGGSSKSARAPVLASAGSVAIQKPLEPRRMSNRNKQMDIPVADSTNHADVPASTAAAAGKAVNTRGRGGKGGKSKKSESRRGA